MLDRTAAVAYASWFRCLSDATRLQLLHLLSIADAPMSVGELVAESGVGQSTVSAHLRRLAELEFIFVERMGTASMVRVNPECLAAFPSAAEVVMGLVPVDSSNAPEPPWREAAKP